MNRRAVPAAVFTRWSKLVIRDAPYRWNRVGASSRFVDDDMNEAALALECERRRDVRIVEPRTVAKFYGHRIAGRHSGRRVQARPVLR